VRGTNAEETAMRTSKTDLIVIASAKAKPGKEADLERALLDVAEPTRRQRGCVQFAVHRAKSDRSTIIGLERWASVADHEQHLMGAHVKELMGRMADILAEPPSIATYEPIDE
jgi:quinol monooxygenase YgiN